MASSLWGTTFVTESDEFVRKELSQLHRVIGLPGLPNHFPYEGLEKPCRNVYVKLSYGISKIPDPLR